ncbi:MAG: hypothetical protein MJ225_00980 [Bacilli bacterium]|nr:hypothetical protein [Bacilli bacterium]
MKNKKVLLGLVLPATLFALAGCGKNKSNNGVTITLWTTRNRYNADMIKSVVDAYNSGQGIIDKVDVKLIYRTGNIAETLNIADFTKQPTEVDIHPLYDQVMIKAVEDKFFENLDPYFEDESLITYDANGERVLDLADFSQNSLDRYRLNYATKWKGEGENLYALPQLSNPTMLYYNEDFFTLQGINIISIAEEDLDAYNLANGTSYILTVMFLLKFFLLL